MNWPVIIVVGIASLAVIIFLFLRNMKDEKQLENQLKNDYQKPLHDKADVEAEEPTK